MNFREAGDDGIWDFADLSSITGGKFYDTWQTLVEAHGDAYHHIEYLKVTRHIESGEILLCQFHCRHGIVLRSIVVRPVPALSLADSKSTYFDIISPFEYGGPIAIPTSPQSIPALIKASETSFRAWCRNESIVCEFVRFSPVLGNAEVFEPEYQTATSAQNVIINLDRSEEEIISDYSASQRRNYRKAERLGISVCREEKTAATMREFQNLYQQSMRRAHASNFYDFNDAYFRDLSKLPDSLLSLYMARSDENEVLAGVMIARDARHAHSHLLGSSERGNKKCANNLLYHFAAVDLAKSGVKILHMGGAAPSQSGVMEFKARFSKKRANYMTGRRKFLNDAFDELCINAGMGLGDLDGQFFPPYRNPIITDSSL